MTKDEFALKKQVQFPALKRWNAHEVTHQEYYKAINRAVDYINAHLNEPVNLYDLADVANISGFHFHRIFKALMSESPGEYIQRLRLEKAVFKLQNTRHTVLEIAEQTGCQSSHALTKAFKKRFGIPPAVFRRQLSHLSIPVETPAFIRIEPEIREITDKQVITVRVVNPFVNTGAFILAWNIIYRNWIPNSRYELRDMVFFEKFLNSPDLVKQDDLLTEVYIPVTRIK
jgi:AraC family transcriptional regulator